jgi:hypothetical protein
MLQLLQRNQKTEMGVVVRGSCLATWLGQRELLTVLGHPSQAATSHTSPASAGKLPCVATDKGRCVCPTALNHKKTFSAASDWSHDGLHSLHCQT